MKVCRSPFPVRTLTAHEVQARAHMHKRLFIDSFNSGLLLWVAIGLRLLIYIHLNSASHSPMPRSASPKNKSYVRKIRLRKGKPFS